MTIKEVNMVTTNQSVSIGTNGKVLADAEYKGLSTDSKPTDCAINSLFLELDTGNFYYFTGATWSKVGGE